MGAKAKVDKKLYYKLKRQLNTPKDDKRVMEKYGIGQTTARAIRNSFDFDSFLERTGRQQNTKRVREKKTPQEWAQTAWFGFSMLTIIALLVVAGLILTWIFCR